MGVCCTSSENKNKIILEKKEIKYLSNNNQNTNLIIDKDSKANPITEEEINKSIDQWKEKTKKRKLKSDIPLEFTTEEKILLNKEADGDLKGCIDEIVEFEKALVKKDKDILHMNTNLFLNTDRAGIDYSNGEICHDFKNINKQVNNRCFSEISSTIHFTVLNSKDLFSSKFNRVERNVMNNNSHKSQSIFNVLDELNNINKIESNKFIIKNDGQNKIENSTKKIFISNNLLLKSIFNILFSNLDQQAQEYSVSLNERSKLTIKKKDSMLRVNNVSITHNNNMHQIHSYIINNRTQENAGNITEQDFSKNNLATIQSSNVSNQELIQENIFYNVEKINPKEYLQDLKKSFEEILERNSTINNIKYPIWNKETHENLNFYMKNKNDSLPLYDEIDGIKLEWKKMIQSIYNNTSKNFISYLNDTIINLKQGTSNNCSLIAAIIEICNYSVKFNRDLMSSIIFPKEEYNEISNRPGFYGIKVFINGRSRIIEVDDAMPYSQIKGQKLFSISEHFFVNLIEKAIFKLYNGFKPKFYEVSFILRSNPAYEIYHLTGWIPEIMMFDDVSNKINLWQRLYSNFKEGNIMVCLGTSELKDGFTSSEYDTCISASTNLIKQHSYSVLEVYESSEKRLMKCKNPWGHTIPTFNPPRKSKDQIDEKRDLKEAENGIFWIDWDNLVNNFSYIFLAWNPDIYSYKYSFISTFKSYNMQSKFYDELYSLEFNPQYVITIPQHKEDFEMRVLLSRHINQLENHDVNRRKSISFKLFWFEGYRIIYPVDDLRVLKSSKREINSDVFIFEASNQIEQYVLVIMKNNCEDESEISFSLDFFSFIEVGVTELPKTEIIKYNKFMDSWQYNKPGGNLKSLNFVNNPQYKLIINSLTHLQIKLETPLMTPIMVCLIENGNHISRVPYHCIINSKHPGFFFNSFSYFECVLNQGEYIVVCALQEEKEIGRYYLEINQIKNSKTNNKSDFKIEKLKLPSYNFVEYLKGRWDNKNRGRKDNLIINDKLLKRCPGFYFNVTNKTKARLILKATSYINNNLTEYPQLYIHLFKFDSYEKYKVIINGTNIMPSAWGFYSDEIELEPCPYGYLVICINPTQNNFSKFELEIHSIQRLIDISPNTRSELKKRNFNILGKWSKANSGGGPENIFFCKNLQYEVSVNKRTSAYLQLTSHDGFLVSMVILNYDKGINIRNICDLNLDRIQNSYREQLNKLEYEEENYSVNTFFEENNNYLIIPFTKNENEVIKIFLKSKIGNFDMVISTDEEISVRELESKNFTISSNIILKGIVTKFPDKFKIEKDLINNLKILGYVYVKFNSIQYLNFHLKNLKEKENTKIGVLLFNINKYKKIEYCSSNLTFPDFNYACHINYSNIDTTIPNEIILVIVTNSENILYNDVNVTLIIDTDLSYLQEFSQVNEEFLQRFL